MSKIFTALKFSLDSFGFSEMLYMMPNKDIVYQALDVLNVGLATLNEEGCFVCANAAYLGMLGVSEDELVGRHWKTTVQHEDHERARTAYQRALWKGRGYVEIRAAREDRSTLYQALTITSLQDAAGHFIGYQCLRHDISGYMRGQEARLMAVESAPNGLLMVDEDGRIQSVNAAIEKLFGYSRAELLGAHIQLLLPAQFPAAQFNELFRQHDATEAVRERESWGLHKKGSRLPIQVFVSRIDAAMGPLLLCTIIDMVERARCEEQLKAARQLAEASSRAKSDFLARMSHEIRTPMNMIMGMNALLLETPLNTQQRQHLDISYRNVRRLLRLVNGILDLAKVEAGEVALEAVPFDVNELISEAAATIASAVERKGLDFRVTIDPDAARYWIGDPERLQQVLLNLIGNSIKFTARGSIDVHVLAAEREDGAPGLRFEISDTGCGVSPSKRGVIFEAFQQGDESMIREYEGTGLGLSIAKTIVELMGGRIWLDEKKGPGSKFVFTIFVAQASEQSVRMRTANVVQTAIRTLPPGLRVLIVEDNPENRFLLEAYLEGLSLSLEHACNGAEALERVRQARFDLILMDVQMPVMDGLTATKEIRAWEQLNGLPPVPVIALTAHALTSATQESLRAGCDAHVSKPIDRADLIAAIARFAKREPVLIPAIDSAIVAQQASYLGNRRRDLATLQSALTRLDFSTIQKIGHNCRGTGKGYGFPEVSELGGAIEQAARIQDAKALAANLEKFDAWLSQVSGNADSAGG